MRAAILAGWLAGTMPAGAAAAQVAPETIPDIQNFSLPAPTPTPRPVMPVSPVPPAPVVTPTPAATPRPAVTPMPRPTPAARATPRPRPTPRATATPTPVPTASAAPAPRVAAPVAPVAAPSPPAPSPAPAQAATVLPAPEQPGRPRWLFPALLAVLVLLGAGVFARRRRRVEPALPAPVAEPEPPAAPPPPARRPEPVPAATPAPRFLDPAPGPAARIDIAPPGVARAGVNLVTATADVTVTVRNGSDVPAKGVALEVRLTSAQPGQDAVIAAIFAGAVERPVTPPFDLAPGESRRVRTVATMPRDAITVLTAAGRPMFVPVVAIRAAHAGGQTVSVHALGIERPGQAKLGPFWLDQPPRMYDTIGVRPHAGRG